jgi:hypothetical protein
LPLAVLPSRKEGKRAKHLNLLDRESFECVDGFAAFVATPIALLLCWLVIVTSWLP